MVLPGFLGLVWAGYKIPMSIGRGGGGLLQWSFVRRAKSTENSEELGRRTKKSNVLMFPLFRFQNQYDKVIIQQLFAEGEVV